MRVCFSGTFNVLHKGHKKLIDKAIKIAGKDGTIYIGVTKGKIANRKKFKKPIFQRVKEIKKYLSLKDYEKNAVIKVISDKFGPAVTGDYDAIIVSEETINNAKEINKKRIENDKKPLKIIKVPYILAEDNKPISSTRILKGEIDKEGRIIK